MIIKGQLQNQEKFNELFQLSSHPSMRQTVQIQQQQIEHQSQTEPNFKPISFPNANDENEQNFEMPKNPIEQDPYIGWQAVRPMRIVTTSAIKYTNDQFTYIRDFSWNIFQVQIIIINFDILLPRMCRHLTN